MLSDIARSVDARLASILDELHRRWTLASPELDEPLSTLRAQVLGGGKRLRPGFVALGAAAAGGDPNQADVIDLGAAIELLHALALIHDDVMDGSDERRNQETAHASFGRRHRSAGWRGESRRFGEGVAILLGDLAHTLADQLVETMPALVRAIWSEMQVELVLGQYLDLHTTAIGCADPAQAVLVARMKSGSYTIERPLQLGVALVGEAPAVEAALARYARPVGAAFQLRDDLLGAFGQPEVTGKPVGDDLRMGKATELLAIATARATPSESVVLARLGTPAMRPNDVATAQRILERTGARAEVEARVQEATAEAVAAVSTPVVPSHVGEALVGLARHLASRVA